jgi:hypothetical protein
MSQRIDDLLENIERDALGLDSNHSLTSKLRSGCNSIALGRPIPDGRTLNLRLHPDVLASAERTLSRSFELIRFAEAPKCVGMGQAPFAPSSSTDTLSSGAQSMVSPSLGTSGGGAKRVLVKTGAVTEEVELARSSLSVMLRGIDSYGDDDASSAAIALAVGGSRPTRLVTARP